MIKQSWNISPEEKFRILNLHENATKNLYLVKEQVAVGTGTSQMEIGGEKGFKYVGIQPRFGVFGNGLDYGSDYFVLAYSGKTGYVCEVVSKNELGEPTDIKILKDKPLPLFDNKNVANNEFVFGAALDENNNLVPVWDQDEKTDNVFLGDVVIQGNTYSIYGVMYVQEGNTEPEPMGVPINWEKTTSGYFKWAQNARETKIKSLEKNVAYDAVPNYDVFVSGRDKYGFISPSTFTSYKIPYGEEEPIEPPEIPTETPEPPPPINLGDSFRDNVSYPSKDMILKNPDYQKFLEFVEKNDVSKYVFDITASASKCIAGTKERRGQESWADDKENYPDVTVDAAADKKDLGNLNLTKARAQHLKDFLVTNISKLKDAKFRVVAQGSIGKCGTEEENKKLRVVKLSVTKL